MYKYSKAKPSQEMLDFYLNIYPKLYRSMKSKKIKFYSICRYNDIIIGIMAVKEYDNVHRMLDVIVHPLHRQKGICTNLRCMGIYHSYEECEIIEFFKQNHNVVGHQRFIRYGFKLVTKSKDWSLYEQTVPVLMKNEELNQRIYNLALENV